MPHYFFHLHDHVDETDRDGIELADADAARAEAILFVSSVLRDDPDMVDRTHPVQVNVTDETGAAICAVTVYLDDTA